MCRHCILQHPRVSTVVIPEPEEKRQKTFNRACEVIKGKSMDQNYNAASTSGAKNQACGEASALHSHSELATTNSKRPQINLRGHRELYEARDSSMRETTGTNIQQHNTIWVW